jgi:diaminopropionate ammonia-lyase
MCEILKNPFYKPLPSWLNQNSAFDNNDILEFHHSLDGYEPTKVYALDGLAKKLGVKSIYVKDESTRFGVNAFKPLGASYTIYRFLKERWEKEFNTVFNISDFKNSAKMNKLGTFTFCAATDGNHGREVSHR